MTDDATVGERPLVVLPTYNERDNIEPMVLAIHRHLPQARVWVVDDNSPDGAGQVADAVAAAGPWREVIHRPGKLGLGTAYVQAFERALTQDIDCVLQMGADFSHDPSYLPQLLAGLADADMVLEIALRFGWRHAELVAHSPGHQQDGQRGGPGGP